MPLPKMPTKPAALLSPKEYPKAEKGKPTKALKAALPEKTKADNAASTPRKKQAVATSTEIAKHVPTVTEKPVATVSTSSAIAPAIVAAAKNKLTPNPNKSGTSRAADKSGVTKLFVLDTNVLMHDPTSLFRFEEHDVYLPMLTLEELDNHKKGMTEVARNARKVSRTLDALIANIDDDAIEKGIPLSKLGNKDAKGRLFFQTRLQNGPTLPEGLPVGKADNQILGVVRNLETEQPGRAIVLVSKDINMRIKARALGLPAEDYFNDHVLEDTDLLYSGIVQLPD